MPSFERLDMNAITRALATINAGGMVRLEGGSAGVIYAQSVQQLWEAVRHFEAQSVNYTIEDIK
jgi:hypothetical protein